MAFGIVDLNSAMTGINDYHNMRHQEDTRGLVEQGNIRSQLDQGVERRMNAVHQSDDTNNNQKKFDAKEKGSNEYSGDGGRRQKKQDESAKDGKVIPKYSGFDMKI